MDIEKMKIFKVLREHLSKEEFELLLVAEDVEEEDMLGIILSKLPPADKFEFMSHMYQKGEELAILFQHARDVEDLISLMKALSELALSIKELNCYNSYKKIAIEEYYKRGIDYYKYEDLQSKLLELYSNEDIINALVKVLQ